jgi:hypothetical protein
MPSYINFASANVIIHDAKNVTQLEKVNRTIFQNWWCEALMWWRHKRECSTSRGKISENILKVIKNIKRKRKIFVNISDWNIFHSWTPAILFSLVATPLVTILHPVFTLSEIIFQSYSHAKQTNILYILYPSFVLTNILILSI